MRAPPRARLLPLQCSVLSSVLHRWSVMNRTHCQRPQYDWSVWLCAEYRRANYLYVKNRGFISCLKFKEHSSSLLDLPKLSLRYETVPFWGKVSFSGLYPARDWNSLKNSKHKLWILMFTRFYSKVISQGSSCWQLYCSNCTLELRFRWLSISDHIPRTILAIITTNIETITGDYGFPGWVPWF